MFKILGILDEYISRFNFYTGKPRRNMVERFYPKEKALADLFEELIIQFQKEQKRNYNYYKKIGKQGHITFYSKDLSKIINSFFVIQGRIATLDKNLFKTANKNEKLSFVEGAYLRFGLDKKNIMRRANTFNKMKTIGFVLKELNCNNIYIFVVRGGIPTIVYLIFDPSEEIRKILEIKDIKSKEYLENLLNRHHFEKIKL